MAITISELTSAYNNADATSYAVASTSPTADAFLVLLYTTRHGTTAPGGTPDAVFSGTWVEADSEQVDGISALGCWTMQLGASPGTAGFNLVMDGGVTAIGASWHLLQVVGADTSGTVVDHTYGPTGTTSTTASVTPPAMSNANNAQIMYSHHRANEATSAEGGWTAGTSRAGTTPNMSHLASWKIAAEDTTPTQTFTTSSRWLAQYLEIKVAGAAPAATAYKWRRNRGNLWVAH